MRARRVRSILGLIAVVVALTTGMTRLPAAAAVVADVPSAPLDAIAVVGASRGEIVVSWDPPADDGGSLITSYTVESEGVERCTTLQTSCVAGDLWPGTYYAFTVRATNAVGASPASTPTRTVLASICGGTGLGPFLDVDPYHPFCHATEWMLFEEITYPQGRWEFYPTTLTSRQAIAAFLYRVAGRPTLTEPSSPTFSDVPANHPFAAEIEWLAASELSNGFAEGTYRPTAPVTRQAVAAMLYRLDGRPAFDPPTVSTFTDVGSSHPFRHEIEWLAGEGIAKGFGDGSFRPAVSVSRQAIAAFLYRHDLLG